MWQPVDANPTDPKYRLELAKSYSDMRVQFPMDWAELEEAVTFDGPAGVAKGCTSLATKSASMR